jgi:hypothetical protein
MAEQSDLIWRWTRLHVGPQGSTLMSDRSWIVDVDDEGGGEFVTVRSQGGCVSEIRIDPGEWPALRAAIDRMIGECQDAHG